MDRTRAPEKMTEPIGGASPNWQASCEELVGKFDQLIASSAGEIKNDLEGLRDQTLWTLTHAPVEDSLRYTGAGFVDAGGVTGQRAPYRT